MYTTASTDSQTLLAGFGPACKRAGGVAGGGPLKFRGFGLGFYRGLCLGGLVPRSTGVYCTVFNQLAHCGLYGA